jgi:hypothetical protein
VGKLFVCFRQSGARLAGSGRGEGSLNVCSCAHDNNTDQFYRESLLASLGVHPVLPLGRLFERNCGPSKLHITKELMFF